MGVKNEDVFIYLCYAFPLPFFPSRQARGKDIYG
jgi:hypothetical protein